MTWWAIVALAAGSWGLKAIGPVIIGERASSPAFTRFAGLLTPALLMALVAVQTFTERQHLVLDSRAAGLAVAGIAVWRRAPFVVVVVLAAVTSAGLRALTG